MNDRNKEFFQDAAVMLSESAESRSETISAAADEAHICITVLGSNDDASITAALKSLEPALATLQRNALALAQDLAMAQTQWPARLKVADDPIAGRKALPGHSLTAPARSTSLQLRYSPATRLAQVCKAAREGAKLLAHVALACTDLADSSALLRLQDLLRMLKRESLAIADDLAWVKHHWPDEVQFADEDVAAGQLDMLTPAAAPRPPAPKPLRQSPEQQAIVECHADALAAKAFAGTGKSTTLDLYARARPRERMLYLTLTKSMAQQAQRRFPRNVECRTSHSVAFKVAGVAYEKKLGNPRARDVLAYLKRCMTLPVRGAADEYVFAQTVLDRVTSHFGEEDLDPEISIKGMPPAVRMPSGDFVPAEFIASSARLAWAGMRDVNDLDLKMPHDGYLKLYQLMQPRLSRYSRILLDEAQDTNGAMLAILQAQQCGKVVVGDSHQNLFTFRGSLDAMGLLRGAQQLSLSTSFRFGPDVAATANALLGVFCSESKQITGVGRFTAEEDPSQAFVYRTNGGLFGGAVDLLTAGMTRLHFVGGVERYQFDLLTQTWWLASDVRGNITDPFLRSFESFEDLALYAEAVKDREVLSRLKIVNTYGPLVPQLVARVKASHVALQAAAEASLATVHQAKGLEWGTVTMGDDFPELLSGLGTPRTRAYLGPNAPDDALLPKDEANIYYVAASRAKCVLNANPQLLDFMYWCQSGKYIAPKQQSIFLTQEQPPENTPFVPATRATNGTSEIQGALFD